MFAAWVADQELQSVKRRTREGLERAKQQGKVLGPPRKINPDQVEAMRRMGQEGASLRRIAQAFECSSSTVLRVLRRDGWESHQPETGKRHSLLFPDSKNHDTIRRQRTVCLHRGSAIRQV